MQKKIKYEKKIKLYKDIIEYIIIIYNTLCLLIKFAISNNNKKFIANYFNFSGIVPFLIV